MKKIKLLPSVFLLIMCIGVLSFGLYAITPAQNTITGSITVNAAKAEVIISAYAYNENGQLESEPFFGPRSTRQGVDIELSNWTFDVSNLNHEEELKDATLDFVIKIENPSGKKLGAYFTSNIVEDSATAVDILTTKPLTTTDNQTDLIKANLSPYTGINPKGEAYVSISFELLKFAEERVDINLKDTNNIFYLNVEQFTTDIDVVANNTLFMGAFRETNLDIDIVEPNVIKNTPFTTKVDVEYEYAFINFGLVGELEDDLEIYIPNIEWADVYKGNYASVIELENALAEDESLCIDYYEGETIRISQDSLDGFDGFCLFISSTIENGVEEITITANHDLYMYTNEINTQLSSTLVGSEWEEDFSVFESDGVYYAAQKYVLMKTTPNEESIAIKLEFTDVNYNGKVNMYVMADSAYDLIYEEVIDGEVTAAEECVTLISAIEELNGEDAYSGLGFYGYTIADDGVIVIPNDLLTGTYNFWVYFSFEGEEINEETINVSLKASYVETYDATCYVEGTTEETYMLTKRNLAYTINGDVVMLSTYNEKPVTEIDDWAFRYSTLLTSIVLSNNLIEIPNGTFTDCSSLTSITIPESVERIGEEAFKGCTGLEEVHITNLEAWCNISFGFNVGLQSTYAQPLTYAGDLYLNCELLTDLIIPDTITQINSIAFAGCTSIRSLTIPASVTSVQYKAFIGCTNLKSIFLFASFSAVGATGNTFPAGIQVVFAEGVTDIPALANMGLYSVVSVILPASINSVHQYAFNLCLQLTSITVAAGDEAMDFEGMLPVITGKKWYLNDSNEPLKDNQVIQKSTIENRYVAK